MKQNSESARVWKAESQIVDQRSEGSLGTGIEGVQQQLANSSGSSKDEITQTHNVLSATIAATVREMQLTINRAVEQSVATAVRNVQGQQYV